MHKFRGLVIVEAFKPEALVESVGIAREQSHSAQCRDLRLLEDRLDQKDAQTLATVTVQDEHIA